MKLADLRRLTIRKQLRIAFPLPDSHEAILNEHGVISVPTLKQPPSFSLQDHLAQAERFRVETVASDRKQNLSRAELEKLLSELAPQPVHAAHDDE